MYRWRVDTARKGSVESYPESIDPPTILNRRRVEATQRRE